MINKKIYCQLFELEDTIKAQWIADPCETLECEYIVPENILSNSEFTGNADDWFLANSATWNNDAIDFTQPGSAITQIPSSPPTIDGHCYLVTFTISNFVNGDLITVSVGDNSTSFVPANGSYSLLITAIDGAGIFIADQSSLLTEYTIDSVYLYDLTASNCYGCPDNGNIYINPADPLTSNDGAFCHIQGLATVLPVNTSLVINAYYGIQIVVSDRTQGSVRIVAGTVVSDWFDSNGIKTAFLTSDGTSLTIEMDSDFDGCVSFLKADVYPGIGEWGVALTDIDGNVVGQLNDDDAPYLRYDDDYVTFNWPISDGNVDGDSIAEGCYRICVTDPCPEISQTIVDDDIEIGQTASPDFTKKVGVAESFTGISTVGKVKLWKARDTGTFTGDVRIYIELWNSGTPTGVLGTVTISNADWLALPHDEEFEVDFGCIAIDANVEYAIVVFPTTADDTNHANLGINSASFGYTSTLIFDNDDGWHSTPGNLYFKIMNCGCDYLSNCISIKDEHPCTVRMEASCNKAANGFKFTANFSLMARVRTLFINPFSKNRNENYKKSNGSYYKNFAERDKVWEVIFDYVDEITHDYLDVMLICDTLLLYNPVSFPANEAFVWMDDSYRPEWDKEGRQSLAQSRIELRKASGHLTNSNCS